jgi:hypothetical protein
MPIIQVLQQVHLDKEIMVVLLHLQEALVLVVEAEQVKLEKVDLLLLQTMLVMVVMDHLVYMHMDH